MKHPHADERRRPSLDRQLEGAGLFSTVPGEMADEGTPAVYAELERPDPNTPSPYPGPHRVGRRSFTQDVAHADAMAVAPNMREKIYQHLVGILPRGETREEIAAALTMKLQTVCGRVNDLLTWEVDGKPAPRVREGEMVGRSARVYAIPSRSHSLTRPNP